MQSRGWQLLYVLLIAGTAYAETTDDLLNGQWNITGSILDHTCDGCYLDGHVHTDWQGGAITQTIDLSQYTNQSEFNYYTRVTACENQIGGHCNSGNLDTFTVTLTTDTGDNWTDTFYVGNQWEDVDLYYTPTADATTAELSVYGIDNGFWGGWYGPVYYAGQFTATYDPNYVPPAPEPVPVTEDPAVQSVVLDSVIMPTVDPVATVEIPTISVEVATVEVEVSTPDPEAPTASSEPTATSTPESSESSSQSDTEPSGGSSEPSGGKSSTSTAVATVMSNIDVASASMDTIGDIAGDPASPVAQVLALAVMAAQGVEIEDVKLDQPELPKGPKLKDNKKLADRMWINALASDAKFDKYMVEAQWK